MTAARVHLNAHVEETIRDFSRPEAYPHPVRTPIEVRQTHISTVFLTGGWAYKIRKPVDFGFLDYTTIEARRHFSLEELRLNRRLCPDMYLEVAPVFRSEGQLQLQLQPDGGPGEPVDWAVRMRQLDERRMLPTLLETGSPLGDRILDLANLLARFHAQARSDAETASFGRSKTLLHTLEQCLPLPPVESDDPSEPLPSSLRREIEAVQLQRFRSLEPVFAARARDGWVREGHGDLRLQNICFDPALTPGIQVFDCVEFTAQFRCLDVASDLAYLVMDLHLAGRADLAWQLRSAYLEAGGNPGSAALFEYYHCFRACVRGKIALLAAEQQEVPEEERRAHVALASAAFDLAGSGVRPRSQPRLLIVMGASGSGKSVVARELARRLPAVHLATDVLRKELAGVSLRDRLDASWYSPERVEQVYTHLAVQTALWLQRGADVIADGTYLRRKSREELLRVAAAVDAPAAVLVCECPDGVARARIRRRSELGTDASDAGIQVYENQLKTAEWPDFDERIEAGAATVRTLRVDTDAAPGVLARKLLTALG